MLRKEDLAAALPIVTQLDARGAFLSPTGGSLVDELTSTLCIAQSEYSQVTAVGAANEYIPDLGYIQRLSDSFGSRDRGEFSPHSQAMENHVQVLKKAVGQHLSFARDTAKPLVLDLHKRVSSVLQSTVFDACDEFSIKESRLPVVLIDRSLKEEVLEFADVQLDRSVESMNIPFEGKVSDFIFDYVLTGAKDVDNSIKVWLAIMGEEFMETTWRAVFTTTGKTTISDLFTGRDRGDYAALAFLVTRKLMDNPPTGMNVSLASFNKAVLRIRQQAALRLSGLIPEWEFALKNEILIRSSNGTEIEVYGEVYDLYKQSGGDPTLIMAASMQKKVPTYVKEIQDQQVDLRESWKYHVLVEKEKASKNRVILVKQILRKEALALLTAESKKIFSPFESNPEFDYEDIQYDQYQPFLQASVRIDDILTDFKEGHLDNLWDSCLDLVCKGFFPQTSAHQILTLVELACSKNEGIDIQEALYLATMAYVCDFVFDQVELVCIK